MKKFRDISVRKKLTLLIMVTCSFALISAACVFIIYDLKLARREIVERLTVLANVIGSNSQAAILFDDRSDALETLRGLKAEPNILSGQIYSRDTNLFAEYRVDGSSVSPRPDSRTISGHLFEGNHVHLWREIIIENDTIGFVYLTADLSEFDERLTYIAGIVALAVAVSLVLSFLISAGLQRLISVPIRQLADVARRVSEENDFTLRAENDSTDEVGFLVGHFNKMLDQIQTTNHALKLAHDSLEERVRERTRELEQEVRERRQAEAELRASESRLRQEQEHRQRLATAIEQSPEAVIITGADGTIQYVNAAFERIFERHRNEALSQSAMTLKSDQHDDKFYANLWHSISRGDAWSGSIRRKLDGSSHQFLSVTISPMRDIDNEIVNYVAVCRDVSDQVAIEEQLRQSQKLESVGSLAAGIAHEINTPIQFVGDNLHFIRDSFKDVLDELDRVTNLIGQGVLNVEADSSTGTARATSSGIDIEFIKEEIPSAIEQSLDGVKRVATIVGAMKRFSHPDRGERKAPSDINEAIESTLTVARNELKYVADVQTDYDTDLPSVWCYLSDLNQVFLNLLVNAAHAIADVVGDGNQNKGTITVRTRRENDDVVIEISDTGSGIPESSRDRVFDPFFTTKPVGRGTGQGLAIARSVIVEKHSGVIWFETETGRGTTFYVRLPIREVAAEESLAMEVV